ncbi:unnamed protein product [Allacma fusca]|uniref:Trichoplein keratin filament-binding protein n=1 Tax=Allacma fusca TaxID=39272 RepID=A0A8J2LLT5_9HEXA|nr:unnamed protein product [Allacma fusca]
MVSEGEASLSPSWSCPSTTCLEPMEGYRRYRMPPRERMEREIQRRRDRDRDREEMWSNASKYYSLWETNVTKLNEWTSNKYYNDSLKSYEDRLNSVRKQRELEARREKLKALLKKEEEEYKRELDDIEKEYMLVTKHRCKIRVDPSKQIEYLRQHSAEVQKKKEEERKKEVALRDFVRWKASNPVVRDIESHHQAMFIKKAWDDQVQEKIERDKLAKEQNSQIEDEVKKYQDQQNQKLVEFEKQKKLELDHWRMDIFKQNQELKAREEMTKRLMQQMDEIAKQQRLLKETIDARQRLQEREQYKLLAKFWGKQTRLKIRAMCNERIAVIADEYKMLEYLKHLDKRDDEDKQNANVTTAAEKINAVSKCLEQHRQLEIEREKDSAALFEEEARTFLRQQEIIWDKERKMREGLMEDLIATLHKQIEEKRLNNQKNQESIDLEKKEILMRIEERDKQVAEEEAKSLKLAEEMRTQLTQQSYEKRKQKEKEMLESLDMLSRLKIEEDQEKLYFRSEESRLKLEGYKPKFFGFKKLAW